MDIVERLAIVITLCSCFVSCQVPLNLRLKDGDASYEGRLEVRYNGEWGTVCSKTNSLKTANVTCKEFGMVTLGYFRIKPGPPGGRIWLKDIQCTGTEKSIFDCAHNGWGNTTDCTHEDDVGISCKPKDGAVKLHNTNTSGIGGVSVRYNGEWRDLLYFSSWNSNDVKVVCGQLEYNTKTASVCSNSVCPPINCPSGNRSVKLWINEVNCSGIEKFLVYCSEKWIPGNYCNNSYKAASVNCPVPMQGGWSSWAPSSNCSSLCIDGKQNRTRSCTNPAPANDGEHCIGKNEDIAQCNATADRNITCVKPSITNTSSDRIVTSNDIAVVNCTVTAKPPANITWLKDGVPLNGTRFSVTNSTSGSCDVHDPDPNNQCVSFSTLRIPDIHWNDYGPYVCQGFNEFATISSQPIYFFVQVSPNITSPPVNRTEYSSKNVSFNCTANGKPNVAIQWTKNGTVISNDQTKFMITNSTKENCTIDDPPDHCETFSTLVILFAEPPDNGIYKCIATNDVGHLETSANLYINGTPIIVDHPRDQNVDLLSKVSFMCSADGFPRPHIVWIKNNTILRDKIASSAGRYKRKIYAANTTGNCTISECGVDSTIVINDVTADDLGVYTCKGSNEVGYAIESAQLTNEHNDSSNDDLVLFISFGVSAVLIIIFVWFFVIAIVCWLRIRGHGNGGNGNGGNVAGQNVAGQNVAGQNVAGQNVAGGNIAGGNVAGGNIAGGNVAGGNVAGGNVAGGNVAGGLGDGEHGDRPQGNENGDYDNRNSRNANNERAPLLNRDQDN